MNIESPNSDVFQAEVGCVVSYSDTIEDPNAEAWFLVNVYYDAVPQWIIEESKCGWPSDVRQRRMITKDGILYRFPSECSTAILKHFTPNERIAVREAIERYVVSVST